MTRAALFNTIKITTPVFFGYIAIGIPFGLLAVNAGYPLFLAPLMSLVIYAGAGQYLAVSLFSAGANLPSILIAMLLLNIRHCVYGLSLIEQFRGAGKWKPYLIFALTDETYATLTASVPPEGISPANFYGLVSLLNQCYWTAGTVIGAAAGNLIPFSFAGIDFALTALFAVLLIEQIKKTRDILSVIAGAAAAATAIFFVPSDHILVAALSAGIAVLMLARGRIRERSAGGCHHSVD
ncbi:MAG: AzlC family ABC transporter permease [Treponemataceae bacterium]|nr:MAG: AzlC family ABC transporter permease [Treponemataceae bacterium]